MKNLLVVIITLLLVILVIEVIYDSSHERVEQILRNCNEAMVLDEELGFRYRPNLDIDFQCDQRLPPIRLVTDDAGFRNRARIEKADVIMLGDSFADQAYPVWVEAFESRGLALYNLATQRYTTQHYHLAYRSHGAGKGARYVVVAFFMNDFWELPDFDRWRESGLDWFTFHGGTYGGEPIDRDLSLQQRARRLLERSVLFSLIDLSYKHLTYHGKYKGVRTTFAPAYFVRRGINEGSPAFRKTIDNIMAIEVLSRERSSRIIVYLVPCKEHVLFEFCPLPPGFTRESFHEELNGPYDLLSATLADKGVICIDDRERFRETSARGEQLYPDNDLHWNEQGARVAADSILEAIAGLDRDRSGKDRSTQ